MTLLVPDLFMCVLQDIVDETAVALDEDAELGEVFDSVSSPMHNTLQCIHLTRQFITRSKCIPRVYTSQCLFIMLKEIPTRVYIIIHIYYA